LRLFFFWQLSPSPRLRRKRHPRPPPNTNWKHGQDSNWDPSWDQRANPNSGACFYTDASYSGHHFCVPAGDRLPSLPKHFGDHVISIQIFGDAKVRLFNDSNYRNGSVIVIIDHSIDNLRDVPFRGGHTWNKRVSSVVVFERHDRDHDHDRDSSGY
jgi:hypothetical protein